MKYKLTTQAMIAHKGYAYTVGRWQEATGAGAAECTDGVLHYYHSAVEAALYSALHVNIKHPRLWECDASDELGTDGLKGWCKRIKIVRESELPVISTGKRVEFAIRCARQVYTGADWRAWADRWLAGDAAARKYDASAPFSASASSASAASSYASAASSYAAGSACSAFAAYSAYAAAAAAYAAARAARAAGRRLIETALAETFIGEIK